MCLYPQTLWVKPKWLHKDLKLLQGNFVEHPVDYRERVTVACGKCIECQMQKSREWSFRIMHECSLYPRNCFITLTYNDDNLYYNDVGEPSVSRREVQLFMKSLRKILSPLKIRFFACGEYGKQFGRPHYHLIIFNWFPEDAVFFQKDGNILLYRSKLLESVWKKGFSSVGDVSLETAKYCAKYLNKFNFDKLVDEGSTLYYDEDGVAYDLRCDPPFVQMSNRPGIGYGCVYKSDLKSDRVYLNGQSCKIPRYYLKVMERDGVYLDEFFDLRRKQGEIVASCTDLSDKRRRYTDSLNRQVIK